MARSDVVLTEGGPVLGEIGPDFRAFRGIPFAEPVNGTNGWMPPVKRRPWTGRVFNTTEWGDGCPQRCVLPKGLCPTRISADCLNLNVFTPSTSNSTALLPVFVFIPGGHFDLGSAGVSAYDGRFLARRNVIVVTVNYRLGAMGLLVANDAGIMGNYMLMDQRMALQWVQRNIRNFGGDPSRVTIAGESAGAASVVAHMVSPLSTGLFHRAVIQSCPFSLPFKPMKAMNTMDKKFMRKSGCKTLQCLQALPWQKVLETQLAMDDDVSILHPIYNFLPWTPVIDGKDLTAQALDAFRDGRYNKVPVLIGSVSDEGRMFIQLALSKPANRLTYNAVLAALFLKRFQTVKKQYPVVGKPDDHRDLMAKLGTDYIFTAPTRNASVSLSKSVPVYLYQFDHAFSFDGWGPRYSFCNGHSCHGAEIPFEFGTAPLQGLKFNAEEQLLSDSIITYWTNFAKSGDPNIGDSGSAQQLHWPQFTSHSMVNMQLQTPHSYVRTDMDKEICNFWDKLGYMFGVNLW